MTALVALLAHTAFGQASLVHRPVVASAGIAAENGPGAMWVNPANMAYDPDTRYGLFYNQTPGLGRVDWAATVGTGGLGLGVHDVIRRVGDETYSDWSLDYATSVELPERLAFGLLLSWNFVDEGDNYVAYDAGLSWRPLPWLGFGGVAQNIGNPDPTSFALPRTGGGIALRPFERALVLGVDYSRYFLPQSDIAPLGFRDNVVTASARLRPAEGFFLRASADVAAADGGLVELQALAAGFEVFLGGVGGGVHQRVAGAEIPGSSQLGELGFPLATAAGETVTQAFVGSDEPGESLLRSGRRVPVLDIDETPPLQPVRALFSSDEATWLDTLELLRRASEDPGVRGLVLTIEDPELAWAQARELRDAVSRLEDNEKRVTCYLNGHAGNSAYYVASAASEVVMHPAGDLEFVGISAEITNFGGLLDWVGVEPQFVRQAEYKSAVEQFTRREPSAPSLEQTNALLDDTYAELVASVAAGRKQDVATVETWVDQGPWTAKAALEAGLVDAVLYPDEVEDRLEETHGRGVDHPDLMDAPQAHSPWEDPSQIAVIYVEGAIVSGEGGAGGLLSARTTGSERIVRALDQAADDDQIKAVVLRIDSPGGSSFASDEIWRSVELVKRAGKPVVVSMGGVAASGGYYIAAGADAIWAEPNTITGSIGVFTGKFSTAELYDRLGIGSTVLARGRNATLNSTAEPWDESQRAKMQEMVDETYAQFKEKVAEGRSLTPEEVEAVARGRVWSGKAALDRGLVDHLGGIQEAIADAKERAEIPDNREVAIVSFSANGNLLEGLAPTLMQTVAKPLTRAAERVSPRPDLDALRELLEPALPALIFTTWPEEQIWLMNPWTMDVGPR